MSPDLERSLPALGLVSTPLVQGNVIPAIQLLQSHQQTKSPKKAKGVTSNRDPKKVSDHTTILKTFVTQYQSSVDKSKQERQKQKIMLHAKDDVKHGTGNRAKKNQFLLF